MNIQDKKALYQETKENLVVAKYQLNTAKSSYKTFKRSKKDVTLAKERYKKNKKQYKQAKKEHKKAKENIYGNNKRKLKHIVGSTIRQQQRVSGQILSEDETLARLNKAKSSYGQVQSGYYTGRQIGTAGLKGGKFIGQKGYNLGNRSYNLAKGRGFHLTPERLRWQTKLKNRVKANKWFNRAKGLSNQVSPFLNVFKKPVTNLLKNPISLGGIINLFIILMIVSPFMSFGVIRQSEFDLSKTWAYMTKLDRENSTDKVVYYSNLEDPLLYVNYNYEDLSKKWHFSTNEPIADNTLGRTFLKDFWGVLNGNPDDLKTIQQVYTNDDMYKMSDKKREDFEKQLSFGQQVGKWVQLVELTNFLVPEANFATDDEMVIINRYGYTDKNTLSETSTIKADSGAYVYASMGGKIITDGISVTIESGNTRLTYYMLDNVRVVTDQEIERGTILGEVKSAGNQEVKYEKRKKEDSEWQSLNIGFYFPKVRYTQTTSVIRSIDMSGEKAERVREFVRLVKEAIPEATNEGLAAILGNFDTESGINPKRAEGDYLNPPIGATESSWDDDAWLSMNGPSIYNGRNPRILRRGLGLGQFTDTTDGAVRHTLLREFANNKGMKWYDLALQVDFMMNGDSPYYRKIFYDIVTSNEDVATLTSRFLAQWEGVPNDKIDARIASANSWYGFLTHSGSGQPLDDMDSVMVTSPYGGYRGLVLQDGSYHADVHNGIDLAYKDGRLNAPVYAVDSGEVIHAGYWAFDGATAVIIKHSDTLYTYYWHLNSVTVKTGDTVYAGQQVGVMGSTGKSSGVHLHLGASRGYWHDFFDPATLINLK